MFETPLLESIDIDDMDDWRLAEAVKVWLLIMVSEILVTCPPMIAALENFENRFEELGWNVQARL